MSVKRGEQPLEIALPSGGSIQAGYPAGAVQYRPRDRSKPVQRKRTCTATERWLELSEDTKARAGNHYQPWTKLELDYLMLTLREPGYDVAIALGRTLTAVQKKRSLMLKHLTPEEIEQKIKEAENS